MKSEKNNGLKSSSAALPSECTTIIVGREMTADGSMIVSRSEDWDATKAKRFEKYAHQEVGPTKFTALDSPFTCELPKTALGYTALPPFDLPGHWGSAGFNDAGVGISATESIFSNDKVLAVDPLVPNGVAENSIYNIVLPYVKTAREGVLTMGALIEKHGIAEGFGVGFVDNKEIWYLETACGHRWIACRIPEDVYFVTGNQSRFRVYDPSDSDNFLGSKDILEFAQANGLYDPSKGAFDFHEAYARDIELDTTYNYPRVWGIQGIFSPDIKNDVTKNTFPVYAKAAKKIAVTDVMNALRFHYNNTSHDPYLNSNPKEPYRPVSIYRTTHTHICHVRPELPKEIGEINYVALGMAALSVYLPYYQGLSSYPECYTIGTDQADNESVYWKYKKVQVLAMANFNKYAPIVQKAYGDFEKEMAQRQKEMEISYLAIYKEQPLKAKELIQEFSDKMMKDGMDLADKLANELFTQLNIDIQAEYRFAGA